MKKLAAILLAMVLVFALAACGGGSGDGGSTEPTEPTEPEEVTFTENIKLVNPYDAGGGVYNNAIIVSTAAPDYLGTTVDVVCMSGNGGQEAIEYVYNQPSDGYTLLVTDYGPLISTAILEDVVYDLDDWVPIAEMSQVIPVFFVRADSPYQTMEDLIEAAKANPGSISVAHGKFNSVPHLPLKLLEELSGADFNEVATTGGSETLTFTLGGSTDVGAGVASTIAPSVQSGDLRVLAVCSGERISEFPDVPTLKELGYDVDMPAWYTIFCKADVPENVRKALEEGFIEAMNSDAAKKLSADMNVTLSARGSEESQKAYETTITNLEKLLAE